MSGPVWLHAGGVLLPYLQRTRICSRLLGLFADGMAFPSKSPMFCVITTGRPDPHDRMASQQTRCIGQIFAFKCDRILSSPCPSTAGPAWFLVIRSAQPRTANMRPSGMATCRVLRCVATLRLVAVVFGARDSTCNAALAFLELHLARLCAVTVLRRKQAVRLLHVRRS